MRGRRGKRKLTHLVLQLQIYQGFTGLAYSMLAGFHRKCTFRRMHTYPYEWKTAAVFI